VVPEKVFWPVRRLIHPSACRLPANANVCVH
jgi:hypothetical protein